MIPVPAVRERSTKSAMALVCSRPLGHTKVHPHAPGSLAFVVPLLIVASLSVNVAAQEPAGTSQRERGIQLYQQGNLDQAIEALNDAVKKNVGDGEAWHYLGLAELARGNNNEARRAFKRALAARLSKLGLLQLTRSANPSPETESYAKRFAEIVESDEKYLELTATASESDKEELENLRWYRDFYKGVTGNEEVFSIKDVTNKLRIIEKPPPNFAGTRAAGTATLRALFSADGTVKHILVVRKVNPDFDRACIEAARAIEFTPAIKDGRKVGVFALIDYDRKFY